MQGVILYKIRRPAYAGRLFLVIICVILMKVPDISIDPMASQNVKNPASAVTAVLSLLLNTRRTTSLFFCNDKPGSSVYSGVIQQLVRTFDDLKSVFSEKITYYIRIMQNFCDILFKLKFSILIYGGF